MKISPNLISLMEMNDVLMFYKGKMANTSTRYGLVLCIWWGTLKESFKNSH